MLPLDHIRVLDLTRLAPGPHCTMILADLGADVIRVGEPGGGRRATIERSRMSEAELTAQRRLAAFNALDRNKRSITLNLKHPEALAAFHDLARTADVVVEACEQPSQVTGRGTGGYLLTLASGVVLGIGRDARFMAAWRLREEGHGSHTSFVVRFAGGKRPHIRSTIAEALA